MTHESVSLRHTPPTQQLQQEQQQEQQQARNPHQAVYPASPSRATSNWDTVPTRTSPKLAHKESSGESSDASKWFEKNNKAAVQRNAPADHDPPFFLRNSSSSETPPDGHPQPRTRQLQPTELPYRPPCLSQFSTVESGVEDFRSVIDDLTVANKRLKQKLKRYEKLYDAHLQDEKLFEVRFHGLSDHKKRELEETLRKFTASLDDTSSSAYPSIPGPAVFNRQASSLFSHSAESGYVSMPVSGRNSSSAPSGRESNSKRMFKNEYSRQQRNVQSYLQDPAGLVPKFTAPLTETAKKKLVVRRLEQIFAGKRSLSGSNPQEVQQEEVAQSAATADRHAREASGAQVRKEGLREARIMSARSGDQNISDCALSASLQQAGPSVPANEQDHSGSGSPDQRPTRPLDLDPHRAQVPMDNMDYIRHLGFTPPDMRSEEKPSDGHGWIYLNLLINMAQLHTVNVTPDFVKDAVSEFSDKFELSQDGRKLRWKGGQEVTQPSSNSSSERFGGISPYDESWTGGSWREHMQTEKSGSMESSVDAERQARRMARAAKEAAQKKVAYNPIFFHKDDSDEDEYFSKVSSHSVRGPSRIARSSKRSSSSRKHWDEGPVIYYKADFCTDLSGNLPDASFPNPSTYKSLAIQPLGVSVTPESNLEMSDSKGPLDTQPMELDSSEERPMLSEADSGLFSPVALLNDTSDESPETMEFQASGLGGVEPSDNFAIRVRRRQTRTEAHTAESARPKNPKSWLYPSKIREALGQHSSEGESFSQPTISEHIVSASRKDLPNSELPPASYLPFDSTSSGDVDSDLDSEGSSSPLGSSSNKEPTPALHRFDLSPTYTDPYPSEAREAEYETSSDNAEGGSVLDAQSNASTHPFAPRNRRRSEIEHQAALADKLAVEIPAGSSAATAGGGSGCNSPTSYHGTSSNRQASIGSVETVSTRGGGLKRGRTSESIGTLLQQPSPKAQKTN
ncbi:hypothetical protein GQ43DRAFT_224346 [Delitschia confertaspora ATCC 74209]|uniref:Frequency clock protein n=1 Tax=Delitschia confertaspora ATCC 74209 TaxID=1513339 RepID=A0A9P4JDC8_9PLEO|nr:hypothetical protein GQ43DRAFT_224346 [Delitschia confertaspora ATCC 74209]